MLLFDRCLFFSLLVLVVTKPKVCVGSNRVDIRNLRGASLDVPSLAERRLLDFNPLELLKLGGPLLLKLVEP